MGMKRTRETVPEPEDAVLPLTYGNTNTFLLGKRPGENGGGFLLIDTDLPGTLPAFYRAIGAAGVLVREIRFVLATHFHPDHIGLIPALMKQGVRLVLAETQKDAVHFSDELFRRDPRVWSRSGVRSRSGGWDPIRESEAAVLSFTESRAFLGQLGLSGEIVPTPSHSPDSISVLLDGGDCFVGDLERRAVLAAYDEDAPVRRDWERILAHTPPPRRIRCAHGPTETLP